MTHAAGRLSIRDILLLLATALAIFLPGFATLPPVDRDEARYATATTQMLATGDYVDIRFQEVPRHLQPAGVYWLQAASAAVFTEPESRAIWAYRLPSLTAALAAVAMTGMLAALYFGRWAGLLAGLVLAACMGLGFEARIAKTDAALLAATTAAQFAFLWIYTGRARSRWPVVAFWAALGVGAMLKGPIILMVAGLTALALAAWDRGFGRLKGLQPLWGLPLALLIAAPWYVAIGVVTDGDFFRVAIGGNLLHKVGTDQQSHGGPIGYHLMAFALTFWPGALLAALAVPFAWRERARPEVRFLVAWVVPTWLVFELVSTKLPHYVVPLFPAIAALTAAAVTAPARDYGRWWKAAFAIFLLVWLSVTLVVLALAPVGIWIYQAALSPLAIGLALLALAALGVMLWRLFAGRADQAVLAAALASLFVSANTFGHALPRLTELWLSPQIVEAARKAAPDCPRPTLVSTPYHEPSMVFLNGPYRTVLADSPAEAARVLAREPACAVAVVGAAGQADFLTAAASLGLSPTPAGNVQGQNYSDGEDYQLRLYRAASGRDTAARP